jgi:hypothetical protein
MRAGGAGRAAPLYWIVIVPKNFDS